MITFTLIVAAIVIVIGGFMLYNSGFDQGYSTGHDHGFRHASGHHLPPMDRWEVTEAGEEALAAKQAEWDAEVNDRIAGWRERGLI